jgi:hypothetical protein
MQLKEVATIARLAVQVCLQMVVGVAAASAVGKRLCLQQQGMPLEVTLMMTMTMMNVEICKDVYQVVTVMLLLVVGRLQRVLGWLLLLLAGVAGAAAALGMRQLLTWMRREFNAGLIHT